VIVGAIDSRHRAWCRRCRAAAVRKRAAKRHPSRGARRRLAASAEK
jgi:hypothetical protein